MINAMAYVSNPYGNRPMGTVIGYAIHHSVTTLSPAATEQEELEHIRRIDRYHVSIEYGGYGYHVTACPSGRSYLCGDLAGQRAHVKGRNHELIGVVAIGDFTLALPAAPQLNAVQDCLTFARQTYGDKEIRGHADWALPGQGTQCAGTLNSYQWAPMPPPWFPPFVDLVRLSHATPFLYTAAYKNDRSELHPVDRDEIQKAIDWHKAG